jgi:hypothetical protein
MEQIKLDDTLLLIGERQHDGQLQKKRDTTF